MPISAPPSVTLLTAASATGAGVAVKPGTYGWVVWGTWDGATASLEFSPNGGTTWIDIEAATDQTANGGVFDLPLPGGHVRVAITGAGTTSLNSVLLGAA